MTGPGGRGPRLWGLIPAAGSGERMGGDRPKQYLEVHGRTILEHTIDALAGGAELAGIMVALARNDEYWPQLDIDQAAVHHCAGGPTRSHSVLYGLRALGGIAGADDWVMVHDAARPNVSAQDIRRLIETVAWEADGGLLALPVSDTIKRERDQRSCETVSRAHLWRAQTPQLFCIATLTRALDRALQDGQAVTDEANAMELLGFKPKLVAGSAANIKVTYPEDMVLLRTWLTAGTRN